MMLQSTETHTIPLKNLILFSPNSHLPGVAIRLRDLLIAMVTAIIIKNAMECDLIENAF